MSDRQRFDYYSNRLIQLANYAKLVNDKKCSLWVTYEQILDDTPSVLSSLKEYLNTELEFSEQYQILKTTGQKGVGDSQGKIKSGKIIRQKAPPPTSLPADIREEAEVIYQTTYQTLSHYCTPTVSLERQNHQVPE